MRTKLATRTGSLRFAAVAAVAALAVAGCSTANSEASDASGPQQLTVWHYWDGNNADTFAAMAKQYEKSHPKVKLKVVNVPGADLLPKIQAGAASRTLPDVAIGDLVTVPRMAQTGRLVDLKDLVPAGTWSDMYDPMLSFGKQDGQQLSIPVSSNDLALMYNKALMTQAGLDPAKPPTTWEELTVASRQIRAKTGKPGFELFTQAGDNGEGLTWNFQVSLWQAGGEFLTADNRSAAFNSAAGRKALQFWVDLVKSKNSPLAPWGEFEKGKAASAQEGSWMVGIWAAQKPFDFGTAAIPAPADGQPATNIGGEQAVVFKSTPAKQKAAADFLTWFDEPEQNLAWSKKTGFLPVRRSVADGQDYQQFVAQESPDMKPFVDALATAHARPNTPKYPEVSLAFAKQIEQALNGRKSVDAALADAEREVNQILAG